ncbi:fumarylacetoacetate hydrolase family protein [Sphingomonas sp. BAUL-RG-20F-R05-02]|uniref:fumarylacetoacetate hydrolase family protein n=1 Tax=Sphingomonas sp. BAUL-RG-20F-R05-02 TaxID=2914830 RepID=UPI001F56295F|nr:fumarylacetoacetate hydrolase family protein [Sphingomonas sp. BAUL-RG-20F-R05-02]
MHVARVAGTSGDDFWALVDPHVGTARRIHTPFAHWAPFAAQGDADAFALAGEASRLADLRLRAPREPGARVFGVGLNYLEHLTRLGRKEPPPHTIAYIKPDSAIVDPGGQISYPAVTAMLDFEVELVAVVARPLENAQRATECLLGYTIGNDVSARDAGKQLGSLDLFTQKALDATAAIGPWITTLDALGGAGQPALDVEMEVNDEIRQRDNSRNMIFSLDELLDYVDARVRLRPGDLLFTGSTAGVGLEDGRFLKPGDRLVARIGGIGALAHGVGPKRVLAPNRGTGRLGIPAAVAAIPDGRSNEFDRE